MCRITTLVGDALEKIKGEKQNKIRKIQQSLFFTVCLTVTFIAAFYMQRPGIYSICFSRQKFSATIFVMETYVLWSFSSTAEQYASNKNG